MCNIKHELITIKNNDIEKVYCYSFNIVYDNKL